MTIKNGDFVKFPFAYDKIFGPGSAEKQWAAGTRFSIGEKKNKSGGWRDPADPSMNFHKAGLSGRHPIFKKSSY